MIDPRLDGVDHVNVYSKGQTSLGRFLTNFAQTPIETEDGPFQSIEGYWYWLSTKDDHLRKLFGFEAKRYGRLVNGVDWLENEEFKQKILRAIDQKLKSYPIYHHYLTRCELPLKHYYIVKGKVIEPKLGKWIIDHLNSYRRIK